MSGRRWVSRAAATAVVVLGLALGQVITTRLPTESVLADPLDRPGRVGEEVELREASVTVTGVRSARTASLQGLERGTSGRWIVVTYDVRPAAVTTTIAAVSITDGSGRLWRGSERIAPGCPQVPPGFRASCTATVEVPDDLLPDATIRLAPAVDERADAVAVIPLGADGTLPPVEDAVQLDPVEFVVDDGTGS